MLSFLEAIILGLVQGVTEWLPISSSGHLALLQQYFDINQPLNYAIWLHLASAFALIYVFKKDLVKMAKLHKDDKRFLTYLVAGTIPLLLGGLILYSTVNRTYYDVRMLGLGFIITSIILIATKGMKGKEKLDMTHAVFIGIAQIIALFPGISRSGMALSAGVLLGLKDKDAARFGFLLGLPAILAATAYELLSFSYLPDLLPLVVAMVTTFAAGVLSLKGMLWVMKKAKLWWFAPYCLILGSILFF